MSDRLGRRRARLRLEGGQAVVAGAGDAIGRAVAVALAAAGSDVVCIDTDEVAASTTAASCADRGVTARAETADLGDPVAAAELAGRLAPELSRLDVLVNVGGGTPSGRLADLGPAGWAAGRTGGLDAVVHACQLLAPSGGDRRRAHIANVVPAAALVAGPDHVAPAITGAGVAALTLALRADRRRSQIGVTLVVAGRTATAVTVPPGHRRLRPPRGGQAPEAVAAAVLRAIRADRAVVLAGPDAQRAWRRRRLVPGAVRRPPGRAATSHLATGSGLVLSAAGR
ncbi:MAG: SDR family NAD(P)-dependent oxidoreductase [Acidimicrobiia bacterium]